MRQKFYSELFFLLKILFLLHLKTRPSKTQLFAIMKNYSIRPKWRANDSKMPKIQMPKSTYHSGTHNYKIFLQTLRSKVLRLSCKCENTPTYFALGTTINNKNYLFSLFCLAWIWRYKNENSILMNVCFDLYWHRVYFDGSTWKPCIFKWAIPGLFFLYFRLFKTVNSKCVYYKFLPMAGFKLRTSKRIKTLFF